MTIKLSTRGVERRRHCTVLEVVEEGLNDAGQELVHLEGVGHSVHEDSVQGKVEAGCIKRSEEPEHITSKKQCNKNSNMHAYIIFT